MHSMNHHDTLVIRTLICRLTRTVAHSALAVGLSLWQEEPDTPSTRPQPEHYRTRAEYRWALRNWKRRHGGSLILLLALAVFFGALTGSQALLWGLVVFAVVVFVIARNRP
jgi:hypothetical protein